MSLSNKLNKILSLQSVVVKVSSIYDKVKKIHDNGPSDAQWNAYCLRTGEHYDLPEGMTEIPSGLFNEQKELKSVSIPATVTKIGEQAFMSAGLESFQVPDSVTTLDDNAFDQCRNLDSFVFSPSVSYIGDCIFRASPRLTEVTFVKTSSKDGTIKMTTDNVGGLSDGRVYEDEWGEPIETHVDIYVHWSEADDGGQAPYGFRNATVHYNFWDEARNTEVFTFPKGFVKIPDYLFYGETATNSKEIYFGDECAEIGDGSFYQAKNLVTVHLPEGLKRIGTYGFRHCSALKLTELPDSVEKIGNYGFDRSGVALTKLPKNLNNIGKDCFYKCSGNTFTEIPEGLRNIGERAFGANTGLTELTFLGAPSKSGIAANVFEGCSNLKTIRVPWAEGKVANAPWGAEDAQIIYNYKKEE